MCCAVFKIDNLPPPGLLCVWACFLAQVSLRKTKGIQRNYQNLWRREALIAKPVIFRYFINLVPRVLLGTKVAWVRGWYFISTHRAKHVNVIKLNAQVNNNGKSTVAHAIMALFKIFDSAHAQPEFFQAVTVIPDVLLFGIWFWILFRIWS